jgi:hypothetical protein
MNLKLKMVRLVFADHWLRQRASDVLPLLG